MSFHRIKGHERPVSNLQAAIASGRLPGAYLFSGPPGVGKRQTAMELTAALNCLHPIQGDSCGECAVCRAIDRLEFPDLHIPRSRNGRIVKTGAPKKKTDDDGPVENPGDTLDGILPRLHYRPVMGSTKVVILDPADGLTVEAGNMLLKTLEEPPKATLFVLITTLESAVLPTIRSRCQRLRFSPLPQSVLQSLLLDRGVSAEDAQLVSRASQGSVATALSLAEEGQAQVRQSALESLMSLLTGSLSERSDLISGFASKGARARKSGELGLFLEMATLFSRDLLWLASKAPEEDIVLPHWKTQLLAASEVLGLEGSLQFSAAVRSARQGLARNEAQKSLLHHLGIQLAALLSPEGREAIARSYHAG